MSAPVIVGTDGSEGSKPALAWAVDEARRLGAPLRVVICEPSHADLQVWGAGPGVHGVDALDREVLRDLAVRTLDAVILAGTDTQGLDVRVEAETGAAAERLLELSKEAQLLVVGAKGNGLLSHLGHASVAKAVIRHARCPVVVVPAADSVGRGTSRNADAGSRSR